jgi:hypothetical protein
MATATKGMQPSTADRIRALSANRDELIERIGRAERRGDERAAGEFRRELKSIDLALSIARKAIG